MAYMRQFFSQTADPMTSLVTALETAMTAQGNWSLFDSFAVTVGGVARTARVWKCSGTANSSGQDYFLILMPMATYSSAGIAQLAVTMCEGWNATTHVGTRPLALLANIPTGTTANVDGFTGAGVALNAAIGYDLTNFAATITPTDLDVFTVINNDIVAFAYAYMTNNTARNQYAGVFGCWDAGYSFTVPAGVPTYAGQSATVNGKYIGRAFTFEGNGSITTGRTTRSVYPNSSFAAGYGVLATPEFGIRGSLGIDSAHHQLDFVGGDITACRLLMRRNTNLIPASDASGAVNGLYGARPEYDCGRLPDGIITLGENGYNGGIYVPLNGDFVTIGGVDYVRMGGASAASGTSQPQALTLYVAKTL